MLKLVYVRLESGRNKIIQKIKLPSKNLWEIDDYLDEVRHIPIFSKNMAGRLRKADKIEIQAGKLTR